MRRDLWSFLLLVFVCASIALCCDGREPLSGPLVTISTENHGCDAGAADEESDGEVDFNIDPIHGTGGVP